MRTIARVREGGWGGVGGGGDVYLLNMLVFKKWCIHAKCVNF